METREILVANTRTQKRSKINTDATTLGELKAALTAEGIDYTDMSFTEGITKTILLDDATPLPKNVEYKGNVTNNLIILLTNTRKNIASGAEGSRQEAYALIKEYGLAGAIREMYGRNYTVVSTDKLWEAITEYEDAEDEEEAWNGEYDTEKGELTEEDVAPVKVNTELVQALYTAVKAMVKADVITYQEVYDLAELFVELANRTKEESNFTMNIGNATVTSDDVDAIIASL